jgi:predicted dehydrogenase
MSNNTRGEKRLRSQAFDSKVSRRRFLSLTGVVLALPTIIPGRVLGRQDAPAPSQRITLGLVGCGNMGTTNTEAFLALKECQIAAACDVDKKHLENGVNLVNKHYQNHDCKPYHDYRELMVRKDIDAVMLATPDHWHELVAVEAARHGKDIYGEKPLARTIAEQQAMVKAVQENRRIWQTGSWQRSLTNFRKAAEIVRNGLIGQVTRVEVGLPGGNNNSGNEARSMTPSEPPSELDYDTWIGPSKMMAYIQGRTHRNWRWNYNTGGGQLMDWIGHHCDIAHWGCDFDNSGPSEIEGQGEFPPKDAVWNTATKYRIELRYPHDITMIIAGGYPDIRGGVKWIGTSGWVWVDRGAFEGSNDDWRDYRSLPEELRKVKLYESTNHQKNFLDCIKSRKPTITPVETAHHSAIPGHLGLISMLVGRKIKWDVKTECILDDAEASQLLTRPFRPPWKLG